jgi:hypothetical protein
MPHKLIFQKNPDHVRVEVSGESTPGKEMNEVVDILKQATEICHKEGIKRILAIFDVPGKLPSMAGFDFVELSNKFNWDTHFKLAVVYLHEERLISARFAETVAVNRGYMVKLFENEQEAKSWLLES